MSKEERKVPELRFKGFHDDWEQRELSKVSSISKGKFYSKKDLINEGNQIILYGQLYTNYTSEISFTNQFVHPKSGSIYSKGNEVIIPASGESSEDISIAASVTSQGIILGSDLNIVTPKSSLNNTFLALTLSHGNTKKRLSKYAQGKTIVHLHGSNFKKLSIKFPSIDEQKKIKDLICKVDNLASLHQRKYTQLIRLKKAYLEKIFNQELVFKNEKSIWEEKKFEEFMYKPEKLLKASNIRKNELLTVKLFGKGVEIANQNRSLKLGATTYYKRFAGDFIYGKQNFFNGAFGFISEKLDGYYSSGDVPTLKFNSKIVDRPFFLNYISREIYYKRTEAYSSGTGSKRIHEDTLLEFKIKVPLISEQRRIGILLNRIDDLINFYSHRLKNLNAIKSTYLNKMFI